MEYDDNAIFLDREKRYIFQKKLIDKYKKTLLSMKVNYPGNNRDNNITINIIKCMDNIITEIFNNEIYLKIFRITLEGPIITLLLNMDEIKAKKTCIEIENKHMLGKCIDIDVYSSQSRPIGRREFGYEKRKCFICNGLADTCIKNKVHTRVETLEVMRKMYLAYVNKYYGNRFN